MIDQKAAGRLREILDSYDGSQRDFAKLCGISQSTISKMANGATPITMEVIRGLCLNLGYNPMWIMNGDKPYKLKEVKKSLVTDIKTLRVEIELLKARISGLEKHLK